jgi:hypothetical protein
VVSWMVDENNLLYMLVQRRVWGVDKDRARAGGGAGSKNLRCGCVAEKRVGRSVSVRRPEARDNKTIDQQPTTDAEGGRRCATKFWIVLWAIKEKGKRKRKRRKKRRENFSRSRRAGDASALWQNEFRISWNFPAGART